MVNKITEHTAIWLVAVVGLSISILAFLVIQEHFSTQRASEFQWVAHNRTRLLKQGLEGALEPVRVTRDLILASGEMTHKQFLQATKPLLNRNPGIEMIGLVLLKDSLPQPPEREQRRRFILTHVAVRADESRFMIGFPLDSSPVLRQAIEQTEANGTMTVSGRFNLQHQSKSDLGVMAILPVYGSIPATGQGTDQKLTGFVVAILRLDQLAHLAISYLEPRGVDLLIMDESAKDGAGFLVYYASRLQPVSSFREETVVARFADANRKITEQVQMADRTWSITAMANARFLSAEAFSAGAWVVLVGGILLTLMLVVYLLRIKLSVRERTRLGRLLKDREELFWQMTETVDDLFWAISTDGQQFIYLSPAFESMWAVSCEKAYGNPQYFIDGIHHDDRHLWREGVKQASHEFRPVELFYRVLRPDGNQRWIRDTLFPVHDASGRVHRLVGVAEDITEKKQAEDALRDSESKLRTLFNQSPDTIMTVEGDGTILLMNRGASLDPSGIHGVVRDSAELLPARSQNEYRRLLMLTITDGEVSCFPYEDEDGRWLEIRIVPIVEEGEIPAAMVISTDITEKRQLQAQAIHNARLASIGIMATGVAHDINNPNNAINTAATLFGHIWADALPLFREYHQEQGDFSLGGLSFAAEGEGLGHLITEIRENSRRIEAIVSNLKQLGGTDRGELNERVDINSTLLAAVRVLGSNIGKYTHHWEMVLAKDLPPVRGNLRQIEQVFINIMLNALQALPDKLQSVQIESMADLETSRVLVRVTDEGNGIAAEDIPRVMEPFFSTRLAQGGTGLGLYISHTIISNHKGTMDIASSQGKGTVVTLRLPQMEDQRHLLSDTMEGFTATHQSAGTPPPTH